MEIRRFGVGHRRAEGPPGSRGVSGQVIHADGRGSIVEMAIARRAVIEPHSNPSTSWFICIEGGGLVQVGDERAKIGPGEAVLWPADVPHAVSTELSELRAFVVEFQGVDDSLIRGLIEGRRGAIGSGRPPAKGDGTLAPRTDPSGAGHDPREGEPF